MVLGKKVAIFFIWNGARIRPLEKGRKWPVPCHIGHFNAFFSVLDGLWC